MHTPPALRLRQLIVATTVLLLVAGGFLQGRAATPSAPTTQSRAQLWAQLQAATSGKLYASTAPETGNYTMLRATGALPLQRAVATLPPTERALGFLQSYAPLFGVANPLTEFVDAGVSTDDVGQTHVRLNQRYQGLQVFGAQLVVHMTAEGIVGVSGTAVPTLPRSIRPAITPARAEELALQSMRKLSGSVELRVNHHELAIYRTGLLEGFSGDNLLAYGVEVQDPSLREVVWLDAQSGVVINHISLIHSDKRRIAYSPTYDPANPDTNVRRREGDPPVAPIPPPIVGNPIDNLYDFTGQSYDLFFRGFARDSFDNAGATMRTVYLINDQCPNAYWNGQATYYCPAFDVDDVVSHEWGHAYTEYTHGLIYQFQSGALNESYSDIWGETLDLANGRDGAGGSNNTQVGSQGGQRWLVGEDLGDSVRQVLLRDMWDPEQSYNTNPGAVRDPAKVSSVHYQCNPASDGGGVHTNSGVPNHAYALLCDGGTYNGQTIGAIGFVKATHVYFRAMTVYQVPTSNFPQHADALIASCNDLTGAPLKDFRTGTVSPDRITPTDCAQIEKAILAVELRNNGIARCNYRPLFAKDPPAVCAGSQQLFSENWETGNPLGTTWTLGKEGGATADAFANDTTFRWVTSATFPAYAPAGNKVAFAVDAKKGTCTAGGDISGHYWMDSPAIALSSQLDPVLRFDHYVATEQNFDGGNLKISVNGGAFTVVPAAAFLYNGHTGEFEAGTGNVPPGQNTSPLAGEAAWTGSDQGTSFGSWGTTVVNLGNLTAPNDSVKLRWDFGQDGCNGTDGWYVDNIQVYVCADGIPPTATTAPATATATANPALTATSTAFPTRTSTATSSLPTATKTPQAATPIRTAATPSSTAVPTNTPTRTATTGPVLNRALFLPFVRR